jgi:hypothetical protein
VACLKCSVNGTRKQTKQHTNKLTLFVCSVLFVFWYHSPNVLDTPHICNISRLRVKLLKTVWSTLEIAGYYSDPKNVIEDGHWMVTPSYWRNSCAFTVSLKIQTNGERICHQYFYVQYLICSRRRWAPLFCRTDNTPYSNFNVIDATSCIGLGLCTDKYLSFYFCGCVIISSVQ